MCVDNKQSTEGGDGVQLNDMLRLFPPDAACIHSSVSTTDWGKEKVLVQQSKHGVSRASLSDTWMRKYHQKQTFKSRKEQEEMCVCGSWRAVAFCTGTFLVTILRFHICCHSFKMVWQALRVTKIHTHTGPYYTGMFTFYCSNDVSLPSHSWFSFSFHVMPNIHNKTSSSSTYTKPK